MGTFKEEGIIEKSYYGVKYFCGILTIILCLAAKLAFGSGCPESDHCWTTQDVIDERIDVYAQKALLKMFSNGGNEAAAASSMLYAVKCGQLNGIYLPNQRVPALRAQKYGGYWTIFQDTDDNSKCYKKTSKPNQKPIIVFRERIKNDRQTMSRALSEAWYGCQIPITEARCFGDSGTHLPPISTSFRATLAVSLIDHRTKKGVPNATLHLLFGAAQVDGKPTDSDGHAVFGIQRRGEYTIAVSGTDAGVAQPVTVNIQRPGVRKETIKLLTRTGETVEPKIPDIKRIELEQKRAALEAELRELQESYEDLKRQHDNLEGEQDPSLKGAYGMIGMAMWANRKEQERVQQQIDNIDRELGE